MSRLAKRLKLQDIVTAPKPETLMQSPATKRAPKRSSTAGSPALPREVRQLCRRLVKAVSGHDRGANLYDTQLKVQTIGLLCQHRTVLCGNTRPSVIIFERNLGPITLVTIAQRCSARVLGLREEHCCTWIQRPLQKSSAIYCSMMQQYTCTPHAFPPADFAPTHQGCLCCSQCTTSISQSAAQDRSHQGYL